MRIIKETNINFLKLRKPVLIAAGIYLSLAILMLIFRGLSLGLDFTGGTLVQIRFEKPITVGEIRDALSKYDLANSVIQPSEVPNEFFIRLPIQVTTGEISSTINEALLQIPDNSFETLKVDQIGPKIGKELRVSTIYAIISALAVILIYISFRFHAFKFGVAAVIALVHDVLFTLGIFSIFQLEVSLSTIAAFLTIVGYSLNDTIIVFDRVRENMHSKRFSNIVDLFNKSINETLSRTVITSLTTLFVVFVLVFSHGEIRIFSIAMIIGILVGTYSSIFIASPIVVLWNKEETALRKK